MNIKSLILVILAVIYWSNSASSQVKFGIKAGINTVDVSPNDILIKNNEDRDSLALSLEKANYGVNLGIYLLIKSKHFYIMPELLYNSSNSQYKLKDLGTIPVNDILIEEKYQYLDIPLTMGIRAGFLRLGAGPVGHVVLGSVTDFNGYKQDFEEINFGYQAGIGIDFLSINIDLRYEGNFNEYGDHFNFFGNKLSFSDNPTRLIATIGISF